MIKVMINMTIYGNDTSSNQGNRSITFYTDSLAPRYSSALATPNPSNVSQAVNCSIEFTDTFNITNIMISENSSGTHENHTSVSPGTAGNFSYNIIGYK